MLINEVLDSRNQTLIGIKQMNTNYTNEFEYYMRQLKWYGLFLRTHEKSQIPGSQILTENLNQFETDLTEFTTETYYEDDPELIEPLSTAKKQLELIKLQRAKLDI